MKKLLSLLVILPGVAFAQLQTVDGFWGLKWHQRIDTVRVIVKKRITAVDGILDNSRADAVLEYRNCMYGGYLCSRASLLFYHNQLCAVFFRIPTDDPDAKLGSLTRVLSEKYGEPTTKGPTKGSLWSFQDRTFLMVYKGNSEVTVHLDDGELYEKMKEERGIETRKNKK